MVHHTCCGQPSQPEPTTPVASVVQSAPAGRCAPAALPRRRRVRTRAGRRWWAAACAAIVVAVGVAGVTPATAAVVSRTAGVDRYDTAAAVSRNTYPGGAAVAYVTSGTGFADALAAGPVAARGNGPVLLTEAASLPATTAAELDRLGTTQIVIVGGASAVSDGVAASLAAYGTVTRIAGSDRYDTAGALSRAAFPAGPRSRTLPAAPVSPMRSAAVRPGTRRRCGAARDLRHRARDGDGARPSEPRADRDPRWPERGGRRRRSGAAQLCPHRRPARWRRSVRDVGRHLAVGVQPRGADRVPRVRHLVSRHARGQPVGRQARRAGPAREQHLRAAGDRCRDPAPAAGRGS